jgi:hypothetical protein
MPKLHYRKISFASSTSSQRKKSISYAEIVKQKPLDVALDALPIVWPELPKKSSESNITEGPPGLELPGLELIGPPPGLELIGPPPGLELIGPPPGLELPGIFQ